VGVPRRMRLQKVAVAGHHPARRGRQAGVGRSEGRGGEEPGVSNCFGGMLLPRQQARCWHRGNGAARCAPSPPTLPPPRLAPHLFVSDRLK
jgi:hypothetical protein